MNPLQPPTYDALDGGVYTVRIEEAASGYAVITPDGRMVEVPDQEEALRVARAAMWEPVVGRLLGSGSTGVTYEEIVEWARSGV